MNTCSGFFSLFVLVVVLSSMSLSQAHSDEHHVGKEQVMANINKDHVLEHLDGVINKPKEQMTPEEQNFYYFKLHDYDNNNKLDGLELVSAFAHNAGKYQIDKLFYILSYLMMMI